MRKIRPSLNVSTANDESIDSLNFSAEQMDKVNILMKFGFKVDFQDGLTYPVLVKKYHASDIETASHLNPESLIDVSLRHDGLMQWVFQDQFDSDEEGLEMIFDSIYELEMNNISNFIH